MLKHDSLLVMRSVRIAALLLFFAAAPAPAADLNGFLREKGSGTVALSFNSESYDEFWVGKAKMATPGPLGEIETKSGSAWFAYGVTDKLTLFGNAAYVDTAGDGSAGFEESEFQDVWALAAYRLATFGSDRHSIVGAAGFSTPLSNYVTEAPVAVGDGTTDLLFRVVYQYRIPSFYVSQQVGYDLRNDDAPDGYPLFTEIGGTLGQRVTLSAFYSVSFADDGLDIGGPGFVDQFSILEEEVERVGAKLYVRIGSGFGANVAYFDTLDGRNTGKASGVSVGGVFDF